MKIRGAITLLLFLAWLIFPAMVLGEENSGVKRARTNQVAPDDITAIRVEPSKLVLSNPRYPRRVSISGKLKDGSWIDLSRQAELTPANGFVRVDESGLLYAVKDGESTVEVTAGGRRAELLVTVQGVTEAHPVQLCSGCHAHLEQGGLHQRNLPWCRQGQEWLQIVAARV